MRRILFVILLALAGLAPARADIVIKGSPGGESTSFLTFFEAVRLSGERVVIDGPCFSACTLALSVLPRSRVCTTSRAILGFHAARQVDEFGNEYPAPEATRIVAETYPAPVRQWIRRHGGLTPRPIFLYGPELLRLVPRCEDVSSSHGPPSHRQRPTSPQLSNRAPVVVFPVLGPTRERGRETARLATPQANAPFLDSTR